MKNAEECLEKFCQSLDVPGLQDLIKKDDPELFKETGGSMLNHVIFLYTTCKALDNELKLLRSEIAELKGESGDGRL